MERPCGLSASVKSAEMQKGGHGSRSFDTKGVGLLAFPQYPRHERRLGRSLLRGILRQVPVPDDRMADGDHRPAVPPTQLCEAIAVAPGGLLNQHTVRLRIH